MKRFIGLVAVSLALTSAFADEKEFFGYSGGVGTFSKFGFNGGTPK